LAYYLRFFVLRRIKKLQFLIQSQSIRLAEKQAQLDKKIKEFNEHQQDYQVTMSNVQMLELFIKAIPPKTGWNEIITAMGKAVDQSIDIAAFEIAFLDDKEVTYRGYSYKEEGGYTYRHKPFNTKTSLVSWALAHRQEVVINNFDEEHQLYIEKKDAYYYQSLVVIPFQKDKENVALCAYSIDKHQFNQNEVIMLRILVKFIIHSTN
jgi:transcriptional regulator with GAF, ATPase, and Fis domain